LRVLVIGGGYVGVTVATVFSERGHEVALCERDGEKLVRLKRGELPFFEPGLQEAYSAAQKNGLTAVQRVDRNLSAWADAVFICTGTPSGNGGELDTSGLFELCKSLPPLRRDSVLAVKSTVNPGTTDALAALLYSRGYRCAVAFVPEFLSQGRALYDARSPSRVVLGVGSERAKAMLARLYEGFPIISMKRKEAELVKLAANAYLAVRLAFFGELASLCSALDVDYGAVGRAVGMDPRIGGSYMDTGAGFGGSCLPKDSAALLSCSGRYSLPMTVISGALAANERHKLLPLITLHRYYRSVRGLTIAVLGASFKPDTDDTRNSPGMELVESLVGEGAKVQLFDGAVKTAVQGAKSFSTAKEALVGADAAIVMTAWKEVTELKPSDFISVMKEPLIIDGRACLDGAALKKAGAAYERIGGRV
jgi:UDPglucose 6-dehydrogenase